MPGANRYFRPRYVGHIIRNKRQPFGSRVFVENVKNQLGAKAAHRDVLEADGAYGCASRLKIRPTISPLKMRLQARKTPFSGMKTSTMQGHNSVRLETERVG
jgi:hypothetical protein